VKSAVGVSFRSCGGGECGYSRDEMRWRGWRRAAVKSVPIPRSGCRLKLGVASWDRHAIPVPEGETGDTGVFG